MELDIPKMITELGAFGVLAGAFVWIIKWMLERLSAQMLRLELLIAGMNASLMYLTKLLLQHDATVRGINPSTGSDDNERMSEAVKVYQKLSGELAEVRKMWDDLIDTVKKD